MIVDEPSAVIGGWEALVLGAALRQYQRNRGFARMPADQRADIDRAIADLEDVGRRWSAGRVRTAQDGSVQAGPTTVVQIGNGSPPLPGLLTTGEVARIMGVSTATVKRMVGDGIGRLPAVAVGGRSVRFRQTDVVELLKGRNGKR